MVWFLKKKRESSLEETNHNELMRMQQALAMYHQDLLRVHENLKQSFIKIRQDISVVQDWISHLNDKDKIKESKIKEIESRLEGVGEALSYAVLATEQKEEMPQEETDHAFLLSATTEVEQQEGHQKILNDLTDTQKSMFYRAGMLLKESGQEWITIKALASDLYPNKEYDKVRSTASEYIGILIDAALLNKKRRGKQTYITLTKKGEKFFKQTNKQSVKKEIVKKKRRSG